jgi:hypothetical protein
VGTSLANDDPLNGLTASAASHTRALKNLQVISVPSPIAPRRQKITLSSTQGSSGIADSLTQNAADRTVQGPDFLPGQRMGRS